MSVPFRKDYTVNLLNTLAAEELSPNALELVLSFAVLFVGIAATTRPELLVKVAGIILAVSGLVWLLTLLGLSSGLQFLIASVVLVILSGSQVGSTKGSGKFGFLALALLCFGAVVLTVPGYIRTPTGTIWDVLVNGWSMTVGIVNTGAEWLIGIF